MDCNLRPCCTKKIKTNHSKSKPWLKFSLTIGIGDNLLEDVIKVGGLADHGNLVQRVARLNI